MERTTTVKAVQEVFKDAIRLIEDRDQKYGSMWRTEDMDELFGNIHRKFKGLEHQWKNNNGEVDLEFPLDLINYTAFFLLRLRSEDRNFFRKEEK